MRKWLIIGGLSASGTIVALALLLAFVSPLSRHWVVKAISEHYHANVHLSDFQVSLFPHPTVTGGGLTLESTDHPGGPPLVSIKRFSIYLTWLGLFRHPAHLRFVRFSGLRINILPGPAGPRPASERKRHKPHHLPPLYFQNVSANGAVLTVFSRKPQNPPLVFAISRLRLRSVGKHKAMTFHAILTNPKPVGRIKTKGDFGPWNPDDPGRTPVTGTYSFRNGDLSSIRGLCGTLSSKGQFAGRLNLITVDGETDTPDFGLDLSTHRLPLLTRFNIIVDGMNGDTRLSSVSAVLGKSKFLATGSVIRTTETKGKTIDLVLTAGDADLRDLLLLAVKNGSPPLLGKATVYTRLDLTPGPTAVTQRLRLNGLFVIRSGSFANPVIEQKIVRLSQRGEGNQDEAKEAPVFLDLRGNFALSDATVSFPTLSFAVPGATIELHGTYGLRDENLNFLGSLRLKAKLSQTTTGLKSLLLRPLDPLFEGNGAGTVVPIQIAGTRQNPKIGVRVGKILNRLK